MTYKEAMRQATADYLRKVLKKQGSVRRAAQFAGLNRTFFYRMMKDAGLKPPKPVTNRGNAAWRSLK